MILQAMGLKPTVAVAQNRLALRRHDRYLLCSDGLSEKVTHEEIHGVVLASATLESACSKLIEMALDRGGEDNVTAILAEVAGNGLPPSTDTEPMLLETA